MNEGDSESIVDLALLGQLFEEHRPRLLAMLQRRIDPSLSAKLDPEDVLNQAFLRAQRRWGAFRDSGSISPYAWLYRIAQDCLIDAWRQYRGRRGQRRDMPWPERSSVQLGLNLIASGTSPSEAAFREELRRRVRTIMELLSDQDKAILSMRHYDQLSGREAADVLGITENAANVRYARALRRLKELWRRLHDQKGVD
jgi:RNA polymerase sigma-70 factor (ECF subfamily)